MEISVHLRILITEKKDVVILGKGITKELVLTLTPENFFHSTLEKMIQNFV